MPTSQTNPIARIVAMIALATAFIIVIAVIATSGGSDGGRGGAKTQSEERSRAAREALREGQYEVKRGDTLVSISEDTGIPVEVLTQLNPDIDPQVLRQGTRIKLR